jgi:hypothetical protein
VKKSYLNILKTIRSGCYLTNFVNFSFDTKVLIGGACRGRTTSKSVIQFLVWLPVSPGTDAGLSNAKSFGSAVEPGAVVAAHSSAAINCAVGKNLTNWAL